jgi:carboxypeptidase Q
VICRIKREAMSDESVMAYASQLSDGFGPRFTGSQAFRAAGEWAMGRFREFGLTNVHREPFGPMDVGKGIMWSPRGWSYSRCNMRMTRPEGSSLTAIPLLYSTSTRGRVEGEAILAPFPRPGEDLDAYIRRYNGRLKNKVILLADKHAPVLPASSGTLHRYTEEELRELALPVKRSSSSSSASPKLTLAANAKVGNATLPDPLTFYDKLFKFLKREGVLATVQPARGEGGTLFARPSLAPPDLVAAPPPGFLISPEEYNRIHRLLQGARAVRLEVEMETRFEDDRGNWSVLAEIPGGKKKDEIVLIGAHLDSWHIGTGATDNAVNCAVMMAIMRLLKKLDVRMDRTVRVALWGGHEIGTLGSGAYVSNHLLDSKSGQARPEFSRLSCYFNLDYGAGRIRGIYLQGNEKLKPLFEDWLSPFAEWHTTTVSLRSTLGSDQRSFESAGIPGLSFIQDPLNYETRTHHTNRDTLDYAPSEDLKQSVAILTALVYQAAMHETLLPRKAMPKE